MTKQEKDLNYKIDKLYLEYEYKRDSLIIEFYNQNESSVPQDEYYSSLDCNNCDEND